MSHCELVWITPDAEQLVTYIAKVSNPAKQEEPSEKLIPYCIKNKHWSPFEMVNMCVEINTSRTIARQILRHRSFSFQEFSQRYADVSALPTLHFSTARKQHPTNRQSSVEVSPDDPLHTWWKDAQNSVANKVYRVYTVALEHGIAKEVARDVLPEGLTPSRLYMNGTLRSWLHYVELRSGNGTQIEHQQIAKDIGTILSHTTPTIWKAFNEASSNP